MEHPLSSTYGVRLGYFLQSADDYHRHRHRINKKLSKLRRSLEISTKDTKNYKEKEKISSITSENYDSSIRYGDVILYQVERDLLYAEETQLLLDVHMSKVKEKFLVSKYKKALLNAKRLLKIAEHETDDFRMLEILVYAAFASGFLSVSKKRWGFAKNAFSIARCSLQCLYEHQKLPSDLNKELYMDLIDKVVDPVLKVSTLEESGIRSPDLVLISRGQAAEFADKIPFLKKAVDIIRKIDATLVTISSEGEEKEMIKSITWYSYSAVIKSEDEARVVMKALEAEKNVDAGDASSYDPALIAFQDALSFHAQEMERAEVFASDEEKQEAHIILTYLKYNHILLRIRRDITLLEGINRKGNSKVTRVAVLDNIRDYLKILEGVNSSIEEIRELPGVSNDDELTGTLTSLDSYFKTVQMAKLARGYTAVQKCRESLALLQRAHQLIDSTSDFSGDLPGNLPSNRSLTDLKKEVNMKLRNAHVVTVYNDTTAAYLSKEFIIDNTNKFPEISAQNITEMIAPLDLSIEPVNVKPVLFDVAFNYINYKGEGSFTAAPGQEFTEEPEADSIDEEHKKKGGFFGFFSH
ncbi:hypothetical protein FOA43_003699 [Brettanomyces nanus]|uniref:Signal recognition particle subunit SRP68 n=1 Tax=Eeniella nana TaxID=13502 RepID=A0A875S5W2_EENNA|nr:uncharacterized protein FOA43_003699 [Brettanomyces nanus]QPG76313.1 hypothetical protein FOA43_003699 [Brettanomyces nanus]